MYDLRAFYGPNAGYVLDLYERYRENPAAVDAATRVIFEAWNPESQSLQVEGAGTETALTPVQVAHIVAASTLAQAIRERGHLGAHLDPLGTEPLGDPALLTENYNITDEDLL